ncbi:hypothetical protein [Emticicia sp. 17c]|uniref:hypothetical protein n=1 Tax=Emticicia sp. 17c TaxID=3127704 RepID=UPI00301B9EE5
MIKFLGGPLTGLALKITWIETAVCSVVGMMITVSLITYSGDYIQRSFTRIFQRKTKKKVFTKSTRLAVRVRRKFGLIGISFLTPILFSPIGGAILALAFRYHKGAIMFNMLISACVWGIIQSLFLYYAKDYFFK